MKRLKDKSVALNALGAMSGTSLDGIDAALVKTDGRTIESFGSHAYRAYSAEEKAVLRAGLGKWSGPEIDKAQAVVDAGHLNILSGFSNVDVIGFHGQTLAHAPRERGTLQVGDGQGLAALLDMPVVWDFRSMDVELGGEGAPLAPFFHFACAQWMRADAPVAFLNLGGVGNLTWVDPRKSAPEENGALLAFDTGPANALIDDLLRQRLGLDFDKDGLMARKGAISQPDVMAFLARPYFSRVPPKSLDRDTFADVMTVVSGMSDEDAVATLTTMSAGAVARGMEHCPSPPAQVLVTGGGRKNPVMMLMLESLLDCPVKPVEAVGLNGDMLEAQAFAYLAVRVMRGLPTSCPSTTGVRAAVGGGKISLPEPEHTSV